MSSHIKCPLCGSTENYPTAFRKDAPTLQNVIIDTRDAAASSPKGDIELRVCADCSFVFNSLYRQVDYTSDYENCQGHSPRFREHTARAARRVAHRVASLAGSVLIIEVGCGQGDFLRQVVSMIDGEKDFFAIGFDPACRAKDSDKVRFVPEYFGGGAAVLI